jgi:hypothetical protein
LRNISDSDSDVSEDLSPESLSLRVAELENALCTQDKLICKFFCENKKLNLEVESVFSEIISLQSVHDDMSVKPCLGAFLLTILLQFILVITFAYHLFLALVEYQP